ncbi:MAG TPA: pyridoxal phosphate-dependent aminotransferase [Vicinamibacterales bacterium]|jgi:aspartate/methionine/tyrosine aminotransferase|nr:pyridoxal phosphate-dependent aminotransferase [Vicinamibacterales bacterium]
MGTFLDTVPFSGITRIRDLMYSVQDPFRLDQGDVSFDAPETVKSAMARAIAENKSHYLQTTGLPRLRELIAAKLRDKNKTPVDDVEHVLVTVGGIQGLFIICQALIEPGDEVLVPDPSWPPAAGHVKLARGVPVSCPLYESKAWRYDLDELEKKITPRTRVLYLNTPHNPTGGVLTESDLERLAALAKAHDLWVIADEAYEDVVFEGKHTSMASLPGMYDRTIPLYTFSKSYAMTGLRLGYVAIKDPRIRDRAKKALFYTASNVSSVVQYGGIGALEGPQDAVEGFRTELLARRDLFYRGLRDAAGGALSGKPPAGAFYAFVRIDPAWEERAGVSVSANAAGGAPSSFSWRMTEHLIKKGRIGCVPGVDFGANGEGYVRFCFARDRKELNGALESMKSLFSLSSAAR